MPFDWREFLIIAHELRNQASEGAHRTSLSRAYYYVYNLGLSHATQLGFTSTRNRSLHAQLWDWYQKQTNPDIKKMGFTGNRMKSFRVKADYDSTPILAAEVTTSQKRIVRNKPCSSVWHVGIRTTPTSLLRAI